MIFLNLLLLIKSRIRMAYSLSKLHTHTATLINF
jgi:hypothetical protein